MFGCLHADTLINFTDGRSIPIKKVVEEQIKGKVWSYNEDLNKFEEKEIIDWHYNGDIEQIEDFIHFETVGIQTNGGRFGFTVTPNHKVMTDKGWKEAKDITFNDNILSKYNSIINNSLEDFLWGTLIGDCTIKRRDKNTACIAFQDSQNIDYVNWKISKLKQFKFKKNAKRYESNYNFELSKIKDELGQRDPIIMLKNHYSDLGLALWYMDDGHLDLNGSHLRCTISIKRFKNNIEKLNEISDLLKSKKIIIDKIYYKDGTLVLNKDNAKNMMSRICKYIPECMQYKLIDDFKNKYKEFELFSDLKVKEYFVPITQIRSISKTQFKKKGKYDISVKDNHNYIVGGITNGILVHNSPEITSGGKALKFYSSVRIDIRKIESLKKSGEIYANRVRAKIVKNKVAPPFREAEFDIVFGKGIDKMSEIIDLGIEYGFINKSGAWFSLADGTKIGQGKENAKEFFINNPVIAESIKTEIQSKMNNLETETIENKEND